MKSSDRIFVAGTRGMVGSAIVRALHAQGFLNVFTPARDTLDLKDAAAVNAWYARERPDHVFVAAAKVGGILANNNFPADFLYDNLVIEANLIHGAHVHGCASFCFSVAPAFTRNSPRSRSRKNIC